MIKFGEQLLLKLRFNKVVIFLYAITTLFLLFSCKSVPSYNYVEPLYLVDSDAPILVYVPVQSNVRFVEHVLSNFTDISKNDINRIVSRTDNIVISSNLRGNVEFIIQGSYPAFALKSALSKKNGWLLSNIEDSTFSLCYYSNPDLKFQLFSPDTSTIAVSNDVIPIIKKYINEQKLYFDEDDCQFLDSKRIDPKIFDYLTKAPNGEIKFYAQKPLDFLSKFLGKTFNLGINSLCGSLVQSKNEDLFALTLEIELNNPVIVKAAVKMLKLALFPVPAKIVQAGSSKIIISDISFSWKELIKLLM